MKYLKGEKGITLIEMMATMVILFVIGGMFYAVLTQTFTNFHTSEEKITVRQEANLIIAQLTNIHQKSEGYTIEMSTDDSFFTTETDSGAIIQLGHKDYTYKLVVDGDTLEDIHPIDIDLKLEDNKTQEIELTLTNKKSNRNDEFTIITTISRMTAAKP